MENVVHFLVFRDMGREYMFKYLEFNAGNIVLDDWKKANITPIYKNSDHTQASNYRPISLSQYP